MHRLIVFSFGLLMATAAAAQSNIALGGLSVDTAAAIEVVADNLVVDQDSGTAVFEGSVAIGQGDLRITAGRVEVVYGDSTAQIARLLASGGVTFVTATEAAEAQEANYDVTTGLLLLSGDVLLTQGASAISAQEMRINVTDGTATMQGRVRTVLQQGGDE
ncbi:LptA/OstA family protein [Yoonia sp.]|uniref:LptA/OstA family protein n=1 Tax=Yoonia sp. TaxID=2212373 RepID=UPI0023B6E69D